MSSCHQCYKKFTSYLAACVPNIYLTSEVGDHWRTSRFQSGTGFYEEVCLVQRMKWQKTIMSWQDRKRGASAKKNWAAASNVQSTSLKLEQFWLAPHWFPKYYARIHKGLFSQRSNWFGMPKIAPTTNIQKKTWRLSRSDSFKKKSTWRIHECFNERIFPFDVFSCQKKPSDDNPHRMPPSQDLHVWRLAIPS